MLRVRTRGESPCRASAGETPASLSSCAASYGHRTRTEGAGWRAREGVGAAQSRAQRPAFRRTARKGTVINNNMIIVPYAGSISLGEVVGAA